MADDVVFKLTTVYDGAQLASGVGASTATIEEDTAAWKEAFESVNIQIQNSTTALIAELRLMTAEINQIPVATQKAAVESGTSLDLLQAKFVETAEAAKLSAGGIGAAFGGLGALLGGGILAAFFAHFLDETNKEVLELGHLAEKTGISIEALSGLQLVTREIGANFDAAQQSMVRLERAQSLAVEGGKQQQEAFERIGLSIKDIEGLSPEDLLSRVSGAIQKTGSSADVAASAIALLGRGGAAMIPLFRQYGDTLGEVINKTGEETGITSEAYETSLKWQKVTADLSAELRKLGVETIGLLVDGLRGLHEMWIDFRFDVEEAGVRIKQFAADAAALVPTSLTSGSALTRIKDNANEAAAAIAELKTQHSEALGETSGGGADSPKTGGDNPSGAGAPVDPDKRLTAWKLQLQQMQDAADESHSTMESMELSFWENILQTTSLKANEELQIRHTIATLTKDLAKEAQTEVTRTYEEQARAAGEGTQAQITILHELLDNTIRVYGPLSSEAARAYEQIQAASRKASEMQLKDLSDVMKLQEQAAKDAEAEDIRHLNDLQKEADAQIKSQTAQVISAKGGGQGITGSFVSLGAEKQEAAELSAINLQIEADKSAASARQLASDLAALQTYRNAVVADSRENSANAQADAKLLEQIDREVLEAKESDDKREVALHEQAMKEQAQIDQQYQKQAIQDENQIANEFASETDKMLFHTRSFAQAFQTLWRDMVTQAIEHMVRMAAQFVAHELVMTLAHTAGNQARVASDASAASQSAAITSFAALKKIEKEAAQAAAGAYNAMADIPVVGPVLGAVAAAATFTAVMAFGAFAEKGYDVPGGNGVYPTILHPKEMVLPADLAGGVRNMVASGGASAAGAGNSLSIGRLIFAPTVQEPFDVQSHGQEFMDYAIGKFRKLGFSI
jgi:hypothetical protein